MEAIKEKEPVFIRVFRVFRDQKKINMEQIGTFRNHAERCGTVRIFPHGPCRIFALSFGKNANLGAQRMHSYRRKNDNLICLTNLSKKKRTIMINYSIVMRRKNVADKESEKLAYATAQYNSVMDLHKFAAHIASHGSVYSRADIAAVLTLAVDCLYESI